MNMSRKSKAHPKATSREILVSEILVALGHLEEKGLVEVIRRPGRPLSFRPTIAGRAFDSILKKTPSPDPRDAERWDGLS